MITRVLVSLQTPSFLRRTSLTEGVGWNEKDTRGGVEGGCLPLSPDSKLPTVMIARKPLQRERIHQENINFVTRLGCKTDLFCQYSNLFNHRAVEMFQLSQIIFILVANYKEIRGEKQRIH